MILVKIEKFGTCKPARGVLKHGFLTVKGGHKIPISVLKGKEEGKTCFISGGIHGDEINGIQLVQMVMSSLNPKTVKGTIIFLPIINQSGFRAKSYKATEDNKNINRCFAKRCRSISYFVARTIFREIAEKCDFGIDCHDCGKSNVLLPHSRVHERLIPSSDDGSTVSLGRLFGTRIIMLRDGERGMLSTETAKKLKKPVLTVEVGGGMVLWNDFLREALAGIKNILIHHEFIKGKIKLPREQYIIKDLERFTYRSRREGLLHKYVKLGDKVHKGDIIAEIFDPVERKKSKIISKNCGFVFSLKMQDKIDKGESVASIMQSMDCAKHGTKMQRGLKLIKNYPSLWDFAKKVEEPE